ncbi:Asp-tRNA(Asn)/Glu-tRNA(Gln) amidotransferase subunit GatA [Candidatus Uhrbacteria bacterium]|nr:Asp-tRNA(Asn)/Glu-tRNA(Gln) amidotransferase subunit GatA [Candidatus Uhrbacteria bacterium]
MNLNQLTLTEASEGLAQKKFSSEELTRDCLSAIEKQDKKLHAFLTVGAEGALAAAKDVDSHRKKHADLHPLAGIPLAVKDIIATKGMRTTAASKILEGYVPPYDATVVTRLKQRGMVILGKTNLDEFAHGASTENSAFSPTKNPWDTTRVPGGSSGGSTAAVAASECIAALGSDTGGSIRQPAAFCNVVGLKPTYGSVSRHGLLSMTSSTDVIGPITKTVADAALLFDAIAGHDPYDATSSAIKPLASFGGDVTGLTVGIPKEYFGDGIENDVCVAVDAAIQQLRSLGARIVECSLPHTASAIPVYYIITPSEVSANLARYDGIRYGYSVESPKSIKSKVKNLEEVYAMSRAGGFGDEAKRRIMLGTYALSAGYYDAFYVKALQVRTLIREDFDEVFKTVDIILTPTSPHVAFKIGEKTNDPLQLYLEDIFVTAVSLAGLPAISVPCGFSQQGKKKLPIGMQIIGKYNAEATILRAAYAYEQATPWHKERPLLS